MQTHADPRRFRAATLLIGAVSLASGHAMALAAVPTDEQTAESKANVEKWNAVKAEKEAETAAINADKAKSDAEAAKAKAAFGPLGDYEGAEGNTTLGANAGKLEGQLLSGVAGEKAAVAIAGAIKEKTVGKDVFVLAGDEAFGFDIFDAYNAKLQAVSAAITAANKLCPAAGPKTAALPIAAVGAAVELAARLFRTDFTVNNIDITPDDLLLARSVAAALVGNGGTIVVPSMITTPAIEPKVSGTTTIAIAPKNSVIADFVALGAQHGELQDCLMSLNKAPKANKDAIAKLTAASKRYDDFVTGVSAPNDKGAIEIVVAARQAILKDRLAKDQALVLRVKMHSTGGTLYTKKNFWTAFGAPIFHVTGGTVVSYALANPNDGSLVGGGSLMCSSGYHTAKQVHARTTQAMLAKPMCWKIKAEA